PLPTSEELPTFRTRSLRQAMAGRDADPSPGAEDAGVAETQQRRNLYLTRAVMRREPGPIPKRVPQSPGGPNRDTGASPRSPDLTMSGGVLPSRGSCRPPQHADDRAGQGVEGSAHESDQSGSRPRLDRVHFRRTG